MTTDLQRLPGSPGCFVCDNNNSNPRALRLKILWDDKTQTVKIPFTPDATWCGYSEVIHGGLIASVIDEAMAWAIKASLGDWAFTVDFHLRYKKAVQPGQSHVVEAKVAENGRKIIVEAKVIDNEGGLCAQAEGVFLSGNGKAKPRTVSGPATS